MAVIVLGPLMQQERAPPALMSRQISWLASESGRFREDWQRFRILWSNGVESLPGCLWLDCLFHLATFLHSVCIAPITETVSTIATPQKTQAKIIANASHAACSLK